MKRTMTCIVLVAAGVNPIIALAVGIACGPAIVDFIDEQVRKIG